MLILGCTPSNFDNKKLVQKIDTLEMNIYSNEGNKLYSINSPRSIYDRNNNTFSLGKTTINLFKNNEMEYIITSDKSKLANNSSRLELNGAVELKSLLQNNDLLFANNFIWDIKETKYLLLGDVRFENNSVILISNKATLSKDNVIEFFNPVKYTIKDKNNKRSYEINSENAFYDINTKSVSFKSTNKRVRSKIYF